MNICQCDTSNPLVRDGTSQVQRFLKTLDPSYVAVDERELEDLLVFTKRYAQYVKYYDLDNDPGSTENWVGFIEKDITTLIALVARTDTDSIKEKYRLLVENLQKTSSKVNLEALFKSILNLTRLFDGWYTGSVKDLSLSRDLKIIIQSSLKESLEKVIAYIKGAEHKLGFRFADLSLEGYSGVWQLDPGGIAPDTSVYQGSTNKARILSALDEINLEFEAQLNLLAKTIDKASEYLSETLENYPRHQPHFALFLAFLKLFKYAQDHLNQLTQRHLDFYYGEILQLQKKPATPDQVHLIFELAKNASPYAVKKGIALKAGKDETGINLTYKTDKELVVNNAKVGQLKTLFLERKLEGQIQRVETIYAAPQADSKDGAGTPFDTEISKWKTFGEPQSGIDSEERTMPDAILGFAIASPQLFLGGGQRDITIIITFDNEESSLTAPDSDVKSSNFSVYLSGEKEWITPNSPEISFSADSMTIVLTIAEDQPAIVAYDKEVLRGELDTKFPVLKVLLNPDNNPYDYLKNFEITSIDINLIISKVRRLVLQNDQGMLDPNKPFLPFGPAPVLGSAFYIGSEEIFNKKVDRLFIDIEWHGLPATTFATHYSGYTIIPTEATIKAIVDVLSGRVWAQHSDDNSLFSVITPTDDTKPEYTGPTKRIPLTDVLTDRNIAIERFTELTHETARGFVRLKLDGSDFRHKEYPKLLTYNIANQVLSAEETEICIPNEPYTPQVKSLALKYHSDQEFDPDFEQFFHIYPFGDVETEPIPPTQTENKQTKNPLIVKTQNLVPRFTVENTEQEGLFYLELDGLVPSQNVALLFKIAEGSGDAELPVPDINWCYLNNNTWQKFDRKDLLSDTTNGLLTTGIIEFAIPSQATANNTLLPSGTHWLRASVAEHSAAISQLIAVRAQAVTARLEDNHNDPAHLKSPLPDGRIAKLQARVPQIKAVNQPYASFGGKVKELETEYYRRVSERLRHKNRDINIWDYEHLILEKFPSIYKVKCLNHTCSDCEIAPGHVTIVPISNLRNQNAVDLLQPKTSLNTLQEIKTCLSRLISPFIKLEVKNPVYEQILVDFYVQFKPGVDKGFYANMLIDEIIRFLSPWAYDEGSDIVFGEKIHSSSIIDFIEERDEYVDYITDFKMYKIIGDTLPLKPVEEAAAASSRSILVSAAHHEVRY